VYSCESFNVLSMAAMAADLNINNRKLMKNIYNCIKIEGITIEITDYWTVNKSNRTTCANHGKGDR